MLKFIAEDMMNTLYYLPDGIIVGGLLGLGAYIRNRKKGKPKRFYAAVFFFGVYLMILGYLVFFERAAGSRDGVTLELFGTMGKDALVNAYVVENVLLFIPFGCLAPCVYGRMRKPGCCVGAGLVFSVSIELLQLLTKRGFCQLDDVVMNTLGTALGWLIYKGGVRTLLLVRRRGGTSGDGKAAAG